MQNKNKISNFEEKSKIYEMVITGGPCAGKTTCLSAVEKFLGGKGFKVIIVPETATEIISSGISPVDLKTEDFQELLISRSLNKEETTRRALELMGRDAVILYDRGILDNKAYMPNEMFQKVLAKKGLNEIDVRDQYDAVFHLVTAADGAEEYYTLVNNAARSETPEQARQLDAKTKNAWVGHPHLRVIDNSTNFDEKVTRLLGEVLGVIGLPAPIEIENKYLVEKPDLNMLESMGAVKQNILQTYLLSNDENVERRVRQRGINGNFSYYYTEKTDAEGKGRIETERKISESEYIGLLLEGQAMVRKDRYCFLYKNQYFELDVYPNWKNTAILEVELTDENQKVEIPSWIKVLQDVTNDKTYKNASIAKSLATEKER